LAQAIACSSFIDLAALQPSTAMEAPSQTSMNIQAGGQGEILNAIGMVEGLSSVRIMQKRRLLQALTPFDQQSMYVVYDAEDKPLFWVQENTACLQRNCLPHDCAPWNLTYHIIDPQTYEDGKSGKDFPEFMEINRPCSLTCCCLNRPVADVTEKPSGRAIGQLRDPAACCRSTYQVFDADEEERMKTNIAWCQVGVCCPCPGNTIDFPVTDAKSEEPVGTLTKTWMPGDCCPICFKDWDNFQAHFGEASADYKLLLMALTSFIHLRQFSTSKQS